MKITHNGIEYSLDIEAAINSGAACITHYKIGQKFLLNNGATVILAQVAPEKICLVILDGRHAGNRIKDPVNIEDSASKGVERNVLIEKIASDVKPFKIRRPF